MYLHAAEEGRRICALLVSVPRSYPTVVVLNMRGSILQSMGWEPAGNQFHATCMKCTGARPTTAARASMARGTSGLMIAALFLMCNTSVVRAPAPRPAARKSAARRHT